MKYFIVSDIHNFYTEFIHALQSAGFDKNNVNHTLVVLGDLFDRGPQPFECLQFIMGLERKILIRGNHEDLFQNAVYKKELNYTDYTNGTAATIHILGHSINDFAACVNVFEDKLVKQYFECLKDYHELKNSIFVHGWIPEHYSHDNTTDSYTNNWREASPKEWEAARWINGMAAWNEGLRVEGKTIYCGHWHTSWGHHYLHNTSVEFPNYRSTNPDHRQADFSPFIDSGIVALDACTAISHKVNCIVIDDEEINSQE